MPIFKIELTREWTEIDTLERAVEAATAEEAAKLAEQMASEYDKGCPDDVVTAKNGAASDWEYQNAEEIDAEMAEDEDLSWYRCRTEGCTEDPNTGEGYEGYCGGCADKRETTNDG